MDQIKPAQKTTGSATAGKAILIAGLLAGCLDIIAAIVVYVYIMKLTTPLHLLQGIARGALGKSAFTGGIFTALAGLGFHFLIAFLFTIFYFLIFPRITFLRKHRIIAGLFYGIFVWCIMNLVILPLLHISPIPSKWSSIVIGAAILMFCIGLPISLTVSRYFNKKPISGR